MILCAVYKSSKKTNSYLYVKQKGDFSEVPEALMSFFGAPIFVMLIPFNKVRNLGKVTSTEVQQAINTEGFYLQVSADDEDMLAKHRESLGLGPVPDIKF